MDWFLNHRKDLAETISWMEKCPAGSGHRLLAIPARARLERLLRYLLDEEEFLSPYGIRSLSKHHARHPFVFTVGADEYSVSYVPGESDSGSFGGNSNWRGPVVAADQLPGHRVAGEVPPLLWGYAAGGVPDPVRALSEPVGSRR